MDIACHNSAPQILNITADKQKIIELAARYLIRAKVLTQHLRDVLSEIWNPKAFGLQDKPADLARPELDYILVYRVIDWAAAQRPATKPMGRHTSDGVKSISGRSKSKVIWMWTLECALKSIQTKRVCTLSQCEPGSIWDRSQFALRKCSHSFRWILDRSQFAFERSHSDRFGLRSISDRSNSLGGALDWCYYGPWVCVQSSHI